MVELHRTGDDRVSVRLAGTYKQRVTLGQRWLLERRCHRALWLSACSWKAMESPATNIWRRFWKGNIKISEKKRSFSLVMLDLGVSEFIRWAILEYCVSLVSDRHEQVFGTKPLWMFLTWPFDHLTGRYREKGDWWKPNEFLSAQSRSTLSQSQSHVHKLDF